VYSGNYGLTLQLIPMLLGFFTYKLAVIGRQGLQVWIVARGGGGRARGALGACEGGCRCAAAQTAVGRQRETMKS
jgi:hypothetical protein